MTITQINPIPKLNIGGDVKSLNLNLNQSTNLEKILEAGKDDDHDQVYLHDMETNQSYVIEGEQLDISVKLQAGQIPVAIVNIDGKETRVRVKAVADEDNWSKSSVYKNGALGTVGGFIAGAVVGGKLLDMGVLGNSKVAKVGMLVGLVGFTVGGAVLAVRGTQKVLAEQAQASSGISQYLQK